MKTDEQFKDEFVKLAFKRHTEGEQKYGDTWKTDKKDWIDETVDELLDAANYLSYLYVKLRRIQNEIRTHNIESTE